MQYNAYICIYPMPIPQSTQPYNLTVPTAICVFFSSIFEASK